MLVPAKLHSTGTPSWASPAAALILPPPDAGPLVAEASNSIQQQQVAADVIAIREGADLDLSCPIVVQNEGMIISWTCDNEPANIRSSRIHVTDAGKLRIRSAKVGDSCNYRCEAADGYGTLSVIIKVIIVDRRLMEQLAARGSGAASNGTTAQQQAGNRFKWPIHEATETKLYPSHDERPPIKHNTLAQPTGAATRNDSDLEIYIEPAQLRVAKNRTFNLECRVVPPQSNLSSPTPARLPAPQIIWLKEFNGPKPSSLAEALEQNLLLLDDVYYHSLNWPRSITYSQKSTGSSSALLIRQSSYVHSGRYVCFAGYPPPTMLASLMSGAGTNETDPDNTPQPTSLPSFKPIRYKLAQAIVKVDDDEGEAGHKLVLKNAWSLQNGHHYNRAIPMDRNEPAISDWSSARSDNLFARVISSNSWMRNLTIGVTLTSALIILIQFIRVRNHKLIKSPANVNPQQSLQINNQFNPAIEQQSRQPLPRSPLPIDENLLNLKLNDRILNHENQTEVKSLEHIYSEINTRDI